MNPLDDQQTAKTPGHTQDTEIATAAPRPLDEFALADARKSINEEVKKRAQIRGFMPAAGAQLSAATIEFLTKLGKASVKAAADRAGATAVDLGDVEAAYKEVSGRGAERRAWWLAVAGILAGGAIATGVAIKLTPPQHSGWWWVAVAVLGVAALVVLIVNFPRKSA